MHHMSPTIPAETARHVLRVFGHEGGHQPGSFTERLIELLAYADRTNLAKLAQIYPAEAAAVDLAQNHTGGVDQLKRIIAGRASGACTCGVGPYSLNGRCENCTGGAA